LYSLLPPIEVIKGSLFNIDLKSKFGIDDFPYADLEKNSRTLLSECKIEMIETPFAQMSLNVIEY